jgi:hypothetical protein
MTTDYSVVKMGFYLEIHDKLTGTTASFPRSAGECNVDALRPGIYRYGDTTSILHSAAGAAERVRG